MQIGNWNQEYEGEEGKPSAKSHKNQEHKIKCAHVTHIPLYSVYKLYKLYDVQHTYISKLIVFPSKDDTFTFLWCISPRRCCNRLSKTCVLNLSERNLYVYINIHIHIIYYTIHICPVGDWILYYMSHHWVNGFVFSR